MMDTDQQAPEPQDPPEPASAPLRRIEWTQRVGKSMARVGRSIKMVKPLCTPCARLGGAWWATCSHDPYNQTTEREVSEPITKQVDGETIITGRREKIVQMTTPNIRQVGTARNQSSGQRVQKCLNKGWKHLPDVGIAPMCEYLNCYSHDITVRSRYGNFCSEQEARQVALRVLERPVEIHNARRAQAQLNEIAL